MGLKFDELFDWEKESDMQYYALLEYKNKMEWEEYEYYMLQQQPAQIIVTKPELEKNEDNNNTIPL